MSVYRYLLCDLLTDTVIAQLPLTGVSFERRLCRAGSLSATLDAPTPRLVDLARLVHRYAGRSSLWVYRDNAVWWGGIPWTVTPQQDARGAVSVSISAATFDSYAHRRLLPVDKTYTQVDQVSIVADLWDAIQADSRGDIGMETSGLAGSGTLRDRTYLVSDQQFVGKLIEDLGDVIDGPEHTVDVWVDGTGARRKTLRVASQLGAADPRTVFQRVSRGGGRLVSWQHIADAVDGGTVFRTRGDAPNGNVGQDEQPLLSDPVYRFDLLADGWPLLDVTEDHPGTVLVDTLNGYAQALAQQRGGSVPTSSYVVEVGNTGWSPNRIGDTVRLKVSDDWHQGTDITARPVACTVTAADNTTPERVALSFATEG